MTRSGVLMLLVLAAGSVPAGAVPVEELRWKTLGRASCAQCHDHEDENLWWLRDRHHLSADPLIKRDPDYLRVARSYGITTDRALASDGPCAECHAAVPSGAGARPISEGVSCERCHGPASGWLEVHDDGDRNLGRARPELVQAFSLGLRDLEDLDVRATVCTGCHYITDRRLVAAGHTPGGLFDYARGMKTIRHWKDREPVSDEAILQSIAKRRAELGPLPPQALLALSPVDVDSTSGYAIPRRVSNPIVARRPSAPLTPPLVLPPFPTVSRDMTIQQRLAVLSNRLRELAKLSATP